MWDGKEQDIIESCITSHVLVDGCEREALMGALQARYDKVPTLVNSGRSAIQLALENSHIAGGFSVLVPSFGCTGTIQPIIQAGYVPKFMDVGDDLNAHLSNIKDAIDPDVRAVVVPSLYGNPTDLDKIESYCQKNDIYMVDDAAQSIGATHKKRLVGTFGDAGTLSFNLGKIISATGGGVTLTQNHIDQPVLDDTPNQVAQRTINMLLRVRHRKLFLPFCTVMDQIFKQSKFDYPMHRMANLDASLIISQYNKLEDIIKARVRNAKIMDDALDGTCWYRIDTSKNSVNTKYVVSPQLHADKNVRNPAIVKMVRKLAANGVEAEWSYMPLHIREQFSTYKKPKDGLPNTEILWGNVVALPINPVYDEEQMKDIAWRILKSL